MLLLRGNQPGKCRSAKRMGFGVSPFLKDFILGFRVVLACP